jgi:hypothetical protein
MSTFTAVKDPQAVRDYEIDWSTWLAGDTIATSTWTVPAPLTAPHGIDTHTDTTTTVWVGGGTDGTVVRITNTITTAGGRTDERSIALLVRNR